MNENEERDEALFDAALKLPANERAAFLSEACSSDEDLRRRVEVLLDAYERSGGFMEEPAANRSSAEAVPLEDSPAPTEMPGDRIGRYKLLKEIGEGGCGVVYLAEQEEPIRRQVALKVIKLGMDTRQVIARFNAERQALALMDHPHIARVLDAGATEAGRPYFVMELVHGTRITDYCDWNELAPEARLELFIQVCQAVQHAHQKGVIHRDLKPSNILITLVDSEPVPKVIDFGIAKATQGQRLADQTMFTAFEQFIGTPAYMSPEQTTQDVDTRSDVYSLGVLLYELLTGKPPFEEDELLQRGIEEMLRVLREEEPPRPSTRLSTLAPDALTLTAKQRQTDPPRLIHAVRGDLDWIVMKCLEKDRTRRYETANGLAADLQRHLNCEPVTARPPSRWYEFWKTVRRHKLGFAATAALIVALSLGVAASTWQAVRATRAEHLANDRLAEVAAERDAKELARQDAEAIAEFLGEVFQSPDPARDGRTITVAETLDKAAKKLETDLATQPERRAKLQTVIAGTYLSLGLPREAVGLEEKVRDHYFATAGPEHLATLSAMYNLASCYFVAGRVDEALRLHEEVLLHYRKVLGPEHPDTIRAMHNLAVSYFDAGRRKEALELREEVLALSSKTRGPEHLQTLKAMFSLGTSYFDAGRRAEGFKLLEDALALSRKLLGPEHPDTLIAMHNLAAAYFEAGRRDESLRLREEVLAPSRKVFGPEHPDTLRAMSNLAVSYAAAGRQDEALKLREEALALSREALGPEHPDTLRAMTTLGVSYADLGRWDEALTLDEELVPLSRKVLGPEHPDTLVAMNNLANAYDRAGRQDEVLKLREEVLALFRKVLGPEHPLTLSAMGNLAAAYSGIGRQDEALRLREGLVASRRKVLGPEHPDTLWALHFLAISYFDDGRWGEGLKLLTEVSASRPEDAFLAMKCAVLQVWLGQGAEYAATIERELAWGEAATTADDFERIAKIASLRPIAEGPVREAALRFARKAVEVGRVDSSGFPWNSMTLGMAEYRNGNDAEADEALRAAIEAAAATANERDRYLVGCTAGFYRVMVLFHQGKPTQAAALLAATEAIMKPLPADKESALANGADHDDLILWLAYEEARSLLTGSPVPAP